VRCSRCRILCGKRLELQGADQPRLAATGTVEQARGVWACFKNRVITFHRAGVSWHLPGPYSSALLSAEWRGIRLYFTNLFESLVLQRTDVN